MTIATHVFRSSPAKDMFSGFLGTYAAETVAETVALAAEDAGLSRVPSLIAVISPDFLGDPIAAFDRLFQGGESDGLDPVLMLRSAYRGRVAIEAVSL